MRSRNRLLPGTVAVAAIMIIAGCTAFFRPVPGTTATAIFNQLWETFDEMYGPFALRGVDWDAARTTYEPLIDDSMSDDDLFNTLGAMLAELDDGHVGLIAPDREVYRSNQVRRDLIGDDLFDLDVVRDNYLAAGYVDDPNGWYTYGELAGGVAYLYLVDISLDNVVVDDVLDAYPDAPGLIIDLRHNGGGDSTWAFTVFSVFTDEPREVLRSRSKNGPGADDWDAWVTYSLQPGDRYVDTPIAVLVDRFTISAAERATMVLAVLPQSTVVGANTNGAQSTMVARELANGWSVTIAVQEIEFADGSSYEGPGFPPDITVSNSAVNLAAGTDDMLEAALATLP